MVFLWGPELRNTGLQLCEIVHGMVYGFVDLQLTTILKIYLGFKKIQQSIDINAASLINLL